MTDTSRRIGPGPCVLAILAFPTIVLGQAGRANDVNPSEFVFTAVAQLVEAHATVAQGRRHYVQGLTKDRFRVYDEGILQEIVGFEADKSGFSCALLLDTTASMKHELPTLKRAILEFIDELRPQDQVSVYAFSTQLEYLQPFTVDRSAAKRAVLQTRSAGATALFDSVYRVVQDLSEVQGKKALLVFTDGDDNASVLTAQSAIRSAGEVGVPIYSAAQGQALDSKPLLRALDELCESTGGRAFEVRGSKKVRELFAEISRSLRHAYLLAFRPRPAAAREWRDIRIEVEGLRRATIRTKRGYMARP